MADDGRAKLGAVALAALMISSIAVVGIPGGAAGQSTQSALTPNSQAAAVETVVTNVEINTSGHVSEPRQGLTIFSDFPKNGSDVYTGAGPASNLLAPMEGDRVPGVDDAKEQRGQHTGLAGLPVQTDEYAQFEGSLNVQQRAQPAAFPVNPRQEISLSWEIVADDAVNEETVRLDYDDAAEAGLQVNVSATNALIDANSPASNLRGWMEQDLGDGDPTGGASQAYFGPDENGGNEILSVDIDNAANEIAITYENRVNATVRNLDLVLVWEPQDPVEGLDIQDGLDERIDHIFRGPAGDTQSAGFRLVDTGATAITPADRGSADDVLGSAASEVDLSANERADGSTVGTDTASFHIWHGQQITYIAENPDQRVAVHEVATNDADEHVRGDKIYNQRGLPGQAVTMDSSDLEAGMQYFVTFGNDTDRVLVLDVQPLDVQADAPAEVVATDDLEIEVSTADTTGNEVEAWFLEAGDSDVGDVIHVEDHSLDGTGDATLRVSPEADLNAEEGGQYYAMIVHPESETFVSTDLVEVVEAEEARVRIKSPNSDDEFPRGDIVPIELEFQNTDRGTITFGDRDAHNVEINVTVRDTDESGTATVYLNTFQVGHGYVRAGPDGLEANGFDPATEESRNHGFFTHPDDDGSALVGDEGQSAIAHSDIDISGGSQGGVVMSGQYAYDLSSVAGEQPFTAIDQLDDRKQVNVVARDSDSVSLWTAPGEGVNTIDPETVDDIQAGKADGRITPADGVIANEDYLVMEVHAPGLTGVLHEAVLQSGAFSQEDLFQRDDDIITSIWGLTTDDFTWSATAMEPADEAPARGDRLTVDLAQERVIGVTEDNGVNYETFYLPVRMKAGETRTAGSRDLATPQTFAATFEFRRAEGSAAPDDGFVDTQPAVERFAFEAPVASVDTERVQYDDVNDRIEVPAKANVTIPGITNVAAGSNLTVQVNSKSGQGSSFFVLETDVFPRHVEDRNQQIWELTNVDYFADVPDGTEFEIKIRRQGAAGNINPGEAIDGLVLAEPVPDGSLGEVLHENPQLITESDAPGTVKSWLSGTMFNVVVGGDRLGVRTNEDGAIREVRDGGFDNARYRIEVSDSAASDIAASERPVDAAVSAYENDDVAISTGPGVTGIDRVISGITLRLGEFIFGLVG